MRAVNFQGPSGPNDFQRWATESFREIERASRDGMQTAQGFFAYLGSSQTVTRNVITKLTNFTTVVFDTTGHFSTSTQKWTPRGGLVLIHLQVITTPQTAGGQTSVFIYKNGILAAQHNAIIESAADASAGLTPAMDYCDNASGTDYYEAYFFTQGTEATPQALAQSSTYFYGVEL